jgi:hypothetical protein
MDESGRELLNAAEGGFWSTNEISNGNYSFSLETSKSLYNDTSDKKAMEILQKYIHSASMEETITGG